MDSMKGAGRNTWPNTPSHHGAQRWSSPSKRITAMAARRVRIGELLKACRANELVVCVKVRIVRGAEVRNGCSQWQ